MKFNEIIWFLSICRIVGKIKPVCPKMLFGQAWRGLRVGGGYFVKLKFV
jgi:hypothetical protein